jgi:hypothetical protein
VDKGIGVYTHKFYVSAKYLVLSLINGVQKLSTGEQISPYALA